MSDPRGEERRGALFIVGAALAFSVMSVIVKLAGRELPVATLVLARGAVTLVLSYATLLWRGLPPWGNDKRALVLRGLLGLGGLACFFFAVTKLPLGEVTVLHYMNPIFTAIFAAVLLGERFDLRLAGAMIASLTGTMLVVRPAFLFGDARELSAIGVAAALGGALFSAAAYTTVRRLARTEHPDVIVFFFSLVATPAALPFAVATWTPPTARGWLLLLALGVATQLGQVLLTHGLARVPAGRGTTIGYSQVAFATFWGWLLFGAKPTASMLLGAALVAIGAASLAAAPRVPQTRLPKNAAPNELSPAEAPRRGA